MRAFICGFLGLFIAFIIVPIAWMVFKFSSFFLAIGITGLVIGACIYEATEERKQKEKPQ